MRFPKNCSAWNIILVKVILYFVCPLEPCLYYLVVLVWVEGGCCFVQIPVLLVWNKKKRKMLRLFLRVQLVVVFSWIQLHCKMLCIHLTCIYNSIQIQEHRECIYGDVKKKKTKWPSDNTFNNIIMKYLLILCKINKQGFYYFKE